jgi:deazaflavin-dependent oxidoreductase (nitroreductase family)
LAGESFCYLTTTGRRSGRPHEIEIWFAMREDARAVYLLSGGGDRSDWVRNLRVNPSVEVRIAGVTCRALAREVQDGEEDALARRLLVEKYATAYSGDLTNWGRTARPVALDVDRSS